jgi:hypothetical protein
LLKHPRERCAAGLKSINVGGVVGPNFVVHGAPVDLSAFAWIGTEVEDF